MDKNKSDRIADKKVNWQEEVSRMEERSGPFITVSGRQVRYAVYSA